MKTTDNQSEIFDIVDTNDIVIGKATRGEVHKDKNLIHRSIGVAVFNSRGELFLQQRSATKDTDPLKWTISCSGHVASAGPAVRVSQTPLQNRSTLWGSRPVKLRLGVPRSRHPQELVYEEAAHRELQEELGVRNLLLEPVTKYICRAPNETEMSVIYKTVWDGEFKLQKEEIKEGKFFTRKSLIEAVDSGEIELSFMGKVALEKIGILP